MARSRPSRSPPRAKPNSPHIAIPNGHGNQSVVREAWNFNKIDRIHELYIQYAHENLSLLESTGIPEHKLIQLLRIDNLAYAQAMSLDPLLPHELLPRSYQGKRVAELHRKLIQTVTEHL